MERNRDDADDGNDQVRDNVYQGVITNKYGDGVAWSRGVMLGKGSFGSVYLATLKNPRSRYSCFPSVMAVKSAEVSISRSLQKEREVLSSVIGCSNIIQCFGEETTYGDDGQMIYNLLLEFGSGGTLADKIKKSAGKGLPELEVRCFTRSILKALDCIHGVGYVHCDLKPENILLVHKLKRRITNFMAKICDFGLAKRVQKRQKKRKLELYWRGTPMYLSPEAVIDGVQETPSDVWSLGCIVLEMLTGKPAWEVEEGMNNENILRKIGKGNALPKIPSELSIQAKSFLESCLVRKVRSRFSAKKLLNHPFVEGLVDDDDEFEEEEEEEDETEEIEDVDCSSWGFESEDEQTCCRGPLQNRQQYPVAVSLAV